MAPFASSGGLWQKRRAPRDPLPSNGRRPRKPMKTETLATEVPFYPGLSAVADRYDAFIIDLLGVMHDGLRAYPAAVEALRQLRRAGKRSVVLSNAPRRAAVIAKRNAEIGLTDDLPDPLLSSGEAAWQHLKTRPAAWYRALGTRCYPLGPARPLAMRAGLTLTSVHTPPEAHLTP